jgi:GTP cyclohydrolase IA
MNNQSSVASGVALEEGPHPSLSIERPTAGFVGIQDRHIAGMEEIKSGWDMILKGLNTAYDLNIKDENFHETPQRISRMMILEQCAGINSEDECIKILSKNFPAMGKNELDQLIVVANPIICHSTCPHHFSTVTYKVFAGYVPKERFIGISKFARVIKLYAKQPILQESYVSNLCDIFMTGLDPKGVIVIASATHNCMTTRGVYSNPDSTMVTSAMRGCFSEAGGHYWKNEFLALCRNINL